MPNTNRPTADPRQGPLAPMPAPKQQIAAPVKPKTNLFFMGMR